MLAGTGTGNGTDAGPGAADVSVSALAAPTDVDDDAMALWVGCPVCCLCSCGVICVFPYIQNNKPSSLKRISLYNTVVGKHRCQLKLSGSPKFTRTHHPLHIEHGEYVAREKSLGLTQFTSLRTM